MKHLILNPQTNRHLSQYIAHPSHGLLLAGPEGSGKQALAAALAAALLHIHHTALGKYPYYTVVGAEAGKSMIGIESVRELQQLTKLKLPAGGPHDQRIIVIPDAQQMTAEAQNALLKLLEEPPERTTFLLTAASERQLLPTICSRVQHVAVLRPSQADLLQYFEAKKMPAEDIRQAFQLSDGLPGLMYALLDNADHPLKESVQTARALLQATPFERLRRADELARNRDTTTRTLFVLQRMADAALEQAGGKPSSDQSTRSIRQWQTVLRASYEAEAAFATSAQAKLVLTNLMLSL